VAAGAFFFLSAGSINYFGYVDVFRLIQAFKQLFEFREFKSSFFYGNHLNSGDKIRPQYHHLIIVKSYAKQISDFINKYLV
jgi:hypothetical protein